MAQDPGFDLPEHVIVRLSWGAVSRRDVPHAEDAHFRIKPSLAVALAAETVRQLRVERRFARKSAALCAQGSGYWYLPARSAWTLFPDLLPAFASGKTIPRRW